MKRTSIVTAVAVLVAVLCFTPIAQAALVGSYSFEEGSGTMVSDGSDRNNHGTLINPRSDSWTSGHSGKGLYLPGIAGTGATYVDLGNPADFQLTDGFTFTAWVYSTAPNNDAPVLAKEDLNFGTSYWFGVFYNGFGTLCDVDGWWGWDFDNRSLPVSNWSQWNHLAATWDGITVRHYLNGTLVNEMPFAGPIANTASNLTIGINSGVWSTAFTGLLDDINIYNTALTPAEIAKLAENAVSGCVTLQGTALANAKVMLKQDSLKQTTLTDSVGCYNFKTIMSGQTFKIEIAGPAAQ